MQIKKKPARCPEGFEVFQLYAFEDFQIIADRLFRIGL